ncbi:MAG: DUF5615 family PIN-like protein [Nitrososphaerota archaeon]|nr:DUF5615 family PIN-like protein [Nitrososphaerota archaeon]
MLFLAEENVPGSIAAWFRAQGHETQRIAETSLKGRSDRDLQIWGSKNE